MSISNEFHILGPWNNIEKNQSQSNEHVLQSETLKMKSQTHLYITIDQLRAWKKPRPVVQDK